MAAALLIVALVLCFFKRQTTQTAPKSKTNKVDHDSDDDDERRKKDEAAKKQDDADKERGQEPGPFVNGQEDGANAPQPGPPQGIPVEPESSMGQTASYLLQPVNVGFEDSRGSPAKTKTHGR